MSAERDKMTGRLRKYHSNFYYVEADGVQYECALRGLIKKEGTEPLVGDFVELDSVQPQSKTARIHRVLPRKNTISRPKLANVDQVFVVYSLKEPEFDPNQMDRYLTHIELAGLKAILCISKTDLAATQADLSRIQTLYGEQLGYTVVFSSVRQPETLQVLSKLAEGKISVLAGPSGSGKSSLLNALNPALQLRVGEVSEKIARGQHTTRHVELLTLFADQPDTLIADTPGFSNLKLNYVLPDRLRDAFREFAPYQSACAFSDCLHVDEEGCAVLAHRADIAESRYQSYLNMLAEARQHKEAVNSTSQKAEFGYKQLDRKGKDALRILRLKEKNRDASRRVVRQQVSQLEGDLSEDLRFPDVDAE
ncbi:ribosome small subunit-dependent GTPase A [Vampirovibrio chlorellavorus]|uniref:ribosome small subunit-dependent GTPase A n=1 Tax=Vampirovibrio chlorellavorus TaxID=758823 RepID=UPI0026EB79C4|nr:ribosome small subunit-dependent GTPase A [Vampirovibrio chlorellavorus]